MARQIHVSISDQAIFDEDIHRVVDPQKASQTDLQGSTWRKVGYGIRNGLVERVKEFSWIRKFFSKERQLNKIHITLLALCIILGVVGGCGEGLVTGMTRPEEEYGRGWADRVGLGAISALVVLSVVFCLALSLTVCGPMYLYAGGALGAAIALVVRAAVLFRSQPELYGDWAVTSALALLLVVYLAEPLLVSSCIVEMLIRPLTFSFNVLVFHVCCPGGHHSQQHKNQEEESLQEDRAEYRWCCWKRHSSNRYVHVKEAPLHRQVRSSSFSSASSHNSLLTLKEDQATLAKRKYGGQHPTLRWLGYVWAWFRVRVVEYTVTAHHLMDEGLRRPHLITILGIQLCGVVAGSGALVTYFGDGHHPTAEVVSSTYDNRAGHNLVSTGALAGLGALVPTACFVGMVILAVRTGKPVLKVGLGSPPAVVALQICGLVYLGGCLAVILVASAHFTPHDIGTWALTMIFGLILTVLVVEPILVPALLIELLLLPVKKTIRFCTKDLTQERLRSPWLKRLYWFSVPTRYFWRELSPGGFALACAGLFFGLVACSSQAVLVASLGHPLGKFAAGVCAAAVAVALAVTAAFMVARAMYFYTAGYLAACLYCIVSSLIRLSQQDMVDWLHVFLFSVPSAIYLGEFRLFTLVYVQCFQAVFLYLKRCYQYLFSPAQVAIAEKPEPVHIDKMPSPSTGTHNNDGAFGTFADLPQIQEGGFEDSKTKSVDIEPLCQWCHQSFTEDFIQNHVITCGKKLRQCQNCKTHVPASEMKQHLMEDCPMRCVSCMKCGRKVRAISLHAHNHKTCPFRIVKCPQCHGSVTFSSLALHKKTGCPKRPVACPKCLDDVPWSQITEHEMMSCRKRLVQCEACRAMVEFHHLSHHELYDCPLRETKCLRCEEVMPFISLKGHEEEGCPMRSMRCDLCHRQVPLGAMQVHSEQKCPSLLVVCEGCGEKIPQSQLDLHQQKDCQQRKIKCSNCEEVVLYASLETHQKNSCIQRLIKCEACQELVRAVSLADHQYQCPWRLVLCPKGCGEKIPLSTISTHISGDCTTVLHACKCGNKIPLNERTTHLKQCEAFRQTWTSLLARVIKSHGPSKLTEKLKVIRSETLVAPDVALCALAECQGDPRMAIQKLRENTGYAEEIFTAAVACDAKKYVRMKQRRSQT
mmetsp:Transcript_5552/g.7662  ORF Transcript_5552/g.7662 Transcript_5552/m.7662 type:complete len:1154 (-) Transcript_5552:179-3640(-)